MSARTRRILVLCDLQNNSPQIKKIACNKNSLHLPPLRVGELSNKTVFKTVHCYSPEQLVLLKGPTRSVPSVVDIFGKMSLKRSLSNTPSKPTTVFVENIDSTSFIRSSLNKLCSSNIAQILKELKTQVRTIEDATVVLNILFKKAVNEKKFTALYVDFYKQLQANLLVTREEIGKEMPKILLESAQHLFTNIPGEADEEKKTNEDLEIMKFEFLGNCRLISELYKANLVKSALPVLCMTQLSNGGLIALEALAQLMQEVGKMDKNEVMEIKNKIVKRAKEGVLSKRHCIILENGLKALGFNQKLIG